MEDTVRFLTADYKLADVCDDFVSLSYSDAFCDCGEFTCVLPADRKYIPEKETPVLCGDGLVYIVEKTETDTVSETVTLSGRGILSYLARRVIIGAGKLYMRCEELIETLVLLHGAAAVPGTLEYASPVSHETVNTVIENGNLLNCIKEIAGMWGRGLSLKYDFDKEKFIFSVPFVRDRRLGSSDSPVFLSEGFDTVSDAASSADLSGYINKVWVRGAQKPDGTYYMASVRAQDYDFGDSFDDSSKKLRELYVKSGIGTGVYTETGDDGVSVLDESAYLEALRTRGRSELARHRPGYRISARLSAGAAKELSPGDRCTLFSPVTPLQEVRVTEKTVTVAKGCVKYGAELSAY